MPNMCQVRENYMNHCTLTVISNIMILVLIVTAVSCCYLYCQIGHLFICVEDVINDLWLVQRQLYVCRWSHVRNNKTSTECCSASSWKTYANIHQKFMIGEISLRGATPIVMGILIATRYTRILDVTLLPFIQRHYTIQMDTTSNRTMIPNIHQVGRRIVSEKESTGELICHPVQTSTQ